MRCAIWYHLHDLKNVKNTHGGVLLLLKLKDLLKITLFNWCFARFLNCTNDTKSRKASYINFEHTQHLNLVFSLLAP